MVGLVDRENEQDEGAERKASVGSRRRSFVAPTASRAAFERIITFCRKGHQQLAPSLLLPL